MKKWKQGSKKKRMNKTDEQCKRFLPGLSAAAELAMHAIAFFEKRIDTMQLSHFRDIIAQNYIGTHPHIEFVKCFTPVRFPKISNLPKKTHKLRHFFAKN